MDQTRWLGRLEGHRERVPVRETLAEVVMGGAPADIVAQGATSGRAGPARHIGYRCAWGLSQGSGAFGAAALSLAVTFLSK